VLKKTPHEITVEANPESVDEAFLRACKESGVTRLSLGIQSFYEPSRSAVNRYGSGLLLRERLCLVQDVFGASFSVDLISGLPFQDTTVLLKDIEQALCYEPDHVSLYALCLEPGVPLAQKAYMLPDADTADALWITGRNALEQAGYRQYEVSNFSLSKETQSAHNIRYWRMENWLGLGPAASSTIIDDVQGSGWRYTFAPDVERYMSRNRSAAAHDMPEDLLLAEALDPLTLMKETLLMGFRYVEGPDTDVFKQRFHRSIETCIPETIAAWKRKGLLVPGKTALTKHGLLFLDHFLRDAFQELDDFKRVIPMGNPCPCRWYSNVN
jgi:oxygen-independent coproporphyrinogen-3 oxidase